MLNFFTSVQNGLMALCTVFLTICIVIAGAKVGASMKGGAGFREALGTVGMPLFGGMLIGAAAALATAVIAFGGTFKADAPIDSTVPGGTVVVAFVIPSEAVDYLAALTT